MILVAGINGAGKTTSIAKLAWLLKNEMGKKVMVCASDTFRAAAVDQLTIWAERIGVEIVKHKRAPTRPRWRTTPARPPRAAGLDVLIVDTAGRLHTQDHLMRELTKIRDVVAKRIDGAPHEVLLVLDATTGQNAILQAKNFGKAIGVTGIILAKLDGTAKGGVVLSIRDQLEYPGEVHRARRNAAGHRDVRPAAVRGSAVRAEGVGTPGRLIRLVPLI